MPAKTPFGVDLAIFSLGKSGLSKTRAYREGRESAAKKLLGLCAARTGNCHDRLVLLANGDRSLYCGLKQSMDVLV
ncbi:hypothetical protein [Mesorhizobium sp. WSM4884]|uniref:hypothetical protein n=1 Tax=Mesorhizobium sp. WSM4884 TaxID=3038542 RepID=UPI002417EAC2|nr:hypothetical protein [Mesorhizobium sp. WSM4884]MDG4882619.1 hypothetical protein [Mesorhizobium sp. WSM4884]